MLSVTPPLSLIAGRDGLLLDLDHPESALVRVAAPAGGSGPGGCLYPGFRQRPDPLQCPVALADAESVWLASPAPPGAAAGPALSPGRYYRGLYAGVVAGLRLFAVPPELPSSFASNVCPAFDAGGNLVGVTVEETAPDGAALCEANPGNCCASGSGGGGVQVPCCPGITLPTELHITILTNPCGTTPPPSIRWQPGYGAGQWSYGGNAPYGFGQFPIWQVYCIGGGWGAIWQNGGAVMGVQSYTAACSPFALTFTMTGFVPCNGLQFMVTF